MLYRKAEKQIREWIKRDTGKGSALLVSGARQVGKTWLIRDCLQREQVNYLEINLIEEPDLIPVLAQSQNVDDLIVNLSAAKNFTFIKRQSVLFIDEIQELKDLVTRIKFWVDEGSFRYVLSGSLLGIELRNLRSAPVGYLTELKMYPMDFEEFLLASGVTSETIAHLKTSFKSEAPISDIIHRKMMQHFSRYLIVGGMPAAVQEYVASYDITRVSTIQRNIIELYKLDFTKYEEENKKLMLVSVYEQIPSQLMKQNRRFSYADLKKGLRFERLESSFLWLTAAGVAIPVYNVTEPRVALNQNKKSSLLKLYGSDVGLLTCQYGSSIRTKILIGDDKVNLGGIYENAVAMELNSHCGPMYFYNSHKQGELDFLIEQNFSVVPIEVKSGKDYYVHSAMTKVVQNPEYEIEQAYVLGNCNLKREGKILYAPVYMTAFLQEEDIPLILQPI